MTVRARARAGAVPLANDLNFRLAKSSALSRIAYLDHDDVIDLWKDVRSDSMNSPKMAELGFNTPTTRTALQIAFKGAVCEPVRIVAEKKSGCEAYMWVDEECLMITFSGTKDYRDILDNLDMQLIALKIKEQEIDEEPKQYKDQLPMGLEDALDKCEIPAVQRGFLRRNQSLVHKLRRAITKMEAEHVITSIHCTGHSLGGVDAALCALLMIAPTHIGARIPVSVHTFGSPRVGNDSFAEWADVALAENIRVVHFMDVVVYLPFFRAGVGTCIVLTYIDKCDGMTPMDKAMMGLLMFHTCEQYIMGTMKACENQRHFRL